MAGLSDTTPEAERVLLDILRAMPFERKWRQMGVIYNTARKLHAAGVHARHPHATPEEVHADWLRQAGLEGLVPTIGRVKVMDNEESLRVVEHVAEALRQLGIAHALAGSWASSFHGKMRFTHDADICVEPFPGKEQALCSALGDDYYVSLPAIRDALRSHRSFNVIHTPTSFKVDLFVAKPRLFDQSLLARKQTRRVGGDAGISIDMVSAEDVILLKLEWYRLGDEASSQQWTDVLSVFSTQAGALDQAYLDRWAAALGVQDLLERARKEIAPS